MATTILKTMPQTKVCEPVQCVKGDPKHTVPVPYHQSLKNTSHTVLQHQGPFLPEPKEFKVNIYNSSIGVKIPVIVSSTDTIEILMQKALIVRPDLGVNLNLVLNGKPVLQQKTLCELKVTADATFFTFEKCTGG